MKANRPQAAPASAERIAALEAAIAEVRRRQEAKPRSDVHGRMMLALLIAAFERTLERARAALDPPAGGA